MNRKSITLLLCGLSLAIIGCKNNNKSGNTENKTTPNTRAFPELQIPGVMTDVQSRTNYVSEHFWDSFLEDTGKYYSDSLHIDGVAKSVVEEHIATYVTVLGMVPLDKAKASISGLYDKLEAKEKADTSSTSFEQMTELLRFYLYDPNSPYRNEDIYGAYVKRLSTSPLVSEGMQMAYAYDAKMCDLNSVGTKAADFSFKQLDGKVRSLYSIKAKYTLLFFSNPGCPACKQIIDVLMADEKVNSLLADGTLAVVNVYIDDEIDLWKSYAHEYPSVWYSGYDFNHTIRNTVCYNVRAIPSLYVLSDDKTVIMKDAPTEMVMSWLNSEEI